MIRKSSVRRSFSPAMDIVAGPDPPIAHGMKADDQEERPLSRSRHLDVRNFPFFRVTPDPERTHDKRQHEPREVASLRVKPLSTHGVRSSRRKIGIMLKVTASRMARRGAGREQDVRSRSLGTAPVVTNYHKCQMWFKSH